MRQDIINPLLMFAIYAKLLVQLAIPQPLHVKVAMQTVTIHCFMELNVYQAVLQVMPL